jgi:ATP-binding cassette subfamily B protein
MTAAEHLGVWRTVFGTVGRRWRGLATIWVLTLAAAAVALLQPWPIQILVDHVLGQAPGPVWLARMRSWLPGAGSPLGAAAWAGAAAFLIFVIETVFDVALTMRWVRIGQSAVYELGRAVFARLLRRSPAFHAVTPVGDSLSRITGDSWCIYNAASALVFAPLHALAIGGAAAAVLLNLNPRLALVTFIAVPLVTASSILLGRRAGEAKAREREAESRMESHVQQTLTGLSVVQTFAQELREQQRFSGLSGQTLAAQRRSAVIAAVSAAAAGLITTGATGAVLWIGGLEVLRGRLHTGELLVFLAYLATVNSQLTALAGAWTSARGFSASAERVAVVLNSEPEVLPPPSPEPLPRERGAPGLRFHSVTFGYLPNRPVLRGVDLTVQPGETVAVVGASGAGKSTLAALVPRLFDPWEGQVALGGIDVRRLGLGEVRSAVSIVFQEPMLLAGTVADNIRLGRPGASPAEVLQAVRAAGAIEFVEGLPDGIDTLLGERGATLSGGERQRIAIARALVRDAPVLVLDEPTASLDARTEAGLLATLDSARRGRTTLVIAHRLSTVRTADRIAVLDKGRIAELGPHDDLIRRDGIYAGLWRSQVGDQRAEAVSGGLR